MPLWLLEEPLDYNRYGGKYMNKYPSYLIHYGIQGQKWGVRRFQNEDGTYTSEGLERRKSGYGSDKDNAKLFKRMSKAGKNARVNAFGGIKFNVSTDNHRKLAKNKAVKEAIEDEKLNKTYNKWLNTPRKYHEPDPDAIYDKAFKKSGKSKISDLDDIEYHKYLQKADELYQKEMKKFKELDKKDPSTIAYNEYKKELERVSKNLAAEHANDKIGDITYQKHLENIVGYAVAVKPNKKK